MEISEMQKRRERALEALQTAVDELGPITDAARWEIREPVLEMIDQIYEAGEELKGFDFRRPPLNKLRGPSLRGES